MTQAVIEEAIDPSPAPEGWTVARVCAEAGITYRQLDHWLRSGYIQREGDRPVTPGSGHPRHLTDSEVRQAVAIGALVQAGLRAEIAADSARRLTDANEVHLSPRVKLVLVD